MVTATDPDGSNYADKKIGIREHHVTDVSSNDFPSYRGDEEDAWSVERFAKRFRVEIGFIAGDEMEFDLVGLDASIANAFRRILIAEIPTMAIETVFIVNNTSIIQDEVLAARLGLIPIQANPDEFSWFVRNDEDRGDDSEPLAPTDYDTVVMKLAIQCEWNRDAPEDETDPEKEYINSNVYSRHLEFVPNGRQKEVYENRPIRPSNPDILIAKLRPGQEINLLAHCILGIGQDHAKFSPVATASYRLLPAIHITQPIVGEDAVKFSECFPPGVIRLDQEESGEQKAVVQSPRKDTVSRECLRHPEFKDKVVLGRVRDHFIFSIESVGVTPPDTLFLKSVQILKEKCMAVKASLNAQMNRS